jgi:spore coat polysaccharide biosynthesis predicted glycosyltransferase SpsG
MTKKKILFICGSLNQTSMMHQISQHLQDYDHYFTPYYTDGFINYLVSIGYIKFSILNGQFRWKTEEYLRKENLKMDYRGVANEYDLIYTCADLIMPKNIRNKKVILVQEGMTDPETLMFYLVKYLKLPRWLASTSTMGISNLYTIFCVASHGYKDFFIRKGAKAEKIIVTGIPNFDNLQQFAKSDFPHKNFVLVATSDARETYKIENRKKLIKNCVEIAHGRQLIFKLHPNENVERATREINKYAPGALIYSSGNINYMIANCTALITQFSSTVYVGIFFGKEVYSYYDINELKKMLPIQNNGTSAQNIAKVGKHLIDFPKAKLEEIHSTFEIKQN